MFKKQRSILRLLGRDLVILNIFYSRRTWNMGIIWLNGKTSGPFVSSLLFTLLESGIPWVVHKLLEKCFPDWVMSKEKKGLEGNIISTRYADKAFPLPYVSLLFFAQSGLFIMFLTSMNEGSAAQQYSGCSLKVTQWLISVAVTNVAGTDEVGSPYNGDVWVAIRKKINEDSNATTEEHTLLKSQESPAVAKRRAMSWFQFCVRNAFDWVVNCFFREVILGLAPVMLAVVAREDFIKDVLAIFFISKLDDIDDPKMLSESLNEWQNNNAPTGDTEDIP
jgi:hypothetical protein